MLRILVCYAGILSKLIACSVVSLLLFFAASVFASAIGNPELPGGDATSHHKINASAFSHPSQNLSFEDKFKFELGDGLFKRNWVSSPASTRASDGLGPLYNARSCQGCHLKDGRGHPPVPGERSISMFLRLGVPGQDSEPTYGAQLQNQAVAGVPAEGEMHISYEETSVTLAGGEVAKLRRPTYGVRNLGYGPMMKSVRFSPRVAPPVIGLGLIEAIAPKDILAQADPEDNNQDSISGRVHWVTDLATGEQRIGRFGWKAASPTLQQQSEGAFNGDMGMSTPLFKNHWGDCTEKQIACLNAPHGSDTGLPLEISQEVLDLVVFYVSNLAVPKRRNADAETVKRGEILFKDIGCASCHTPAYITTDHTQGHLANQAIFPYTDLLLHDMGEGLADSRPEGDANGHEWRTPPLWGIGLTQVVNGHTFLLHDGRSRNIQEAILWHGGEAQASQTAYIHLEVKKRKALLDFINSL